MDPQEEDTTPTALRTLHISQRTPGYITSTYFADDRTHPTCPPASPSHHNNTPSTSSIDWRVGASQSSWVAAGQQSSTPGFLRPPTFQDSTPDAGVSAQTGCSPLTSLSSSNNHLALESMFSLSQSFNPQGEDYRQFLSPPSFSSTASCLSDHPHTIHDHSPDSSPSHSTSLPSQTTTPQPGFLEGLESRGDNNTWFISSSSSSPRADLNTNSPFRHIAEDPAKHVNGNGGSVYPKSQHGGAAAAATAGLTQAPSANLFQQLSEGRKSMDLNDPVRARDQIAPSPFSGGRCGFTADGVSMSLAASSVISQVLPARRESGSLGSRPSLGLQEIQAQSCKLRSTSMKVSKHRFWESGVSNLLLCCQPGKDAKFKLLASRKNELLVYNWKQKTNLVQVLTSEVRAVTEQENTFWVGLANGSLEVEREGVKVSVQVFNCPVSSIAVGPDGIAWVGSEKGQLRVLELTRGGNNFLEHLDVTSSSVKITAMCNVGRHMVVAQGEEDDAQIQLWRNPVLEAKELDSFLSGPQYKTCTCISSTIWRDTGGVLSSRILTGHSKGHVLMWKGHEMGKLSLLAIIDASLSSHRVRGLSPLPSINALCIGAGSCLYFTELPTAKELEGVPTASVLWTPGRKPQEVTAHRMGLRIMASAHGHVVTTSSQGTVRLWEAPDIIKFLSEVGMVAKDIQTYVPDNMQSQLQQNKLLISSSQLQLLRCIRAGANGEVHLARWKGINVAVKRAHRSANTPSLHYISRLPILKASVADPPSSNANRLSSSSDWSSEASDMPLSNMPRGGSIGTGKEQWRELQREVEKLANMNHVNVERLLGLVLEDVANPMIVAEYYPGSNVHELIQRAANRKVPLPWLRRLEILHDVAAGMLYLHTSGPHGVVHGDLRSTNLLLDRSGCVKIADVGSSRILKDSQKVARSMVAKNPRWCAPESLADSEDTASADVYAFAMIMYELLTLKVPFSEVSNEQVYSLVMEGGRPELPKDTAKLQVPIGYLELLKSCWAQDVTLRPKFLDILHSITAMLKQLVVANKDMRTTAAQVKRTGAEVERTGEDVETTTANVERTAAEVEAASGEAAKVEVMGDVPIKEVKSEAMAAWNDAPLHAAEDTQASGQGAAPVGGAAADLHPHVQSLSHVRDSLYSELNRWVEEGEIGVVVGVPTTDKLHVAEWMCDHPQVHVIHESGTVTFLATTATLAQMDLVLMKNGASQMDGVPSTPSHSCTDSDDDDSSGHSFSTAASSELDAGDLSSDNSFELDAGHHSSEYGPFESGAAGLNSGNAGFFQDESSHLALPAAPLVQYTHTAQHLSGDVTTTPSSHPEEAGKQQQQHAANTPHPANLYQTWVDTASSTDTLPGVEVLQNLTQPPAMDAGDAAPPGVSHVEGEGPPILMMLPNPDTGGFMSGHSMTSSSQGGDQKRESKAGGSGQRRDKKENDRSDRRDKQKGRDGSWGAVHQMSDKECGVCGVAGGVAMKLKQDPDGRCHTPENSEFRYKNTSCVFRCKERGIKAVLDIKLCKHGQKTTVWVPAVSVEVGGK